MSRTSRVPFSPQPDGWTILHTKNCLMLDGPGIPEPEALPLIGPDGLRWAPGCEFIFLGGHKSSAGFEWLDFRKTAPIKYLGEIPAEVNGHACRIAVFSQKGLPNRFGWHPGEESLHWGNASCAGRVIELHRATIVGEPIPMADPAKRGPRRGAKQWPEFHVCGECWSVSRHDKPPRPVPLCPEPCGHPLRVVSSAVATERAEFDALQAQYGDALDKLPPPLE